MAAVRVVAARTEKEVELVGIAATPRRDDSESLWAIRIVMGIKTRDEDQRS